MIEFEQAISELDLRLFEKIASQSTDDDKRSLLAVELAVRELVDGYNYLEIGSYLGGSIQPHLLDARCRSIYSIDKRPNVQPDARGYDWVYNNNSTKRMMELLGAVGPTDKVTTIDGDTRTIDPGQVTDKIDLCFIDGEHTDAMVVADFEFCMKVIAPNAAILFHDAQITYNGIASCIGLLDERGIAFKAYPLPTNAFMVEIGEFPLHRNAAVADCLLAGHKSFVASLQYNDGYRRFATRFPFGFLRRLKLKIRGGNVSE